MSEPQKGWAWFDRDPGKVDGGNGNGGGGEDLPDPGRELRLAYARCLGGPDGDKVLKHLRVITLERALGPSASADMLRHIEGQRQLVCFIAALAQHGRDGG